MASIRVREGNKSFTDSADVTPGNRYDYALRYEVDGIHSTNVVLWSNIENCYCDSLDTEWHGKLSGVRLSGLDSTKVYVKRNNAFDTAEYGNANAGWLTDGLHGWEEIDPENYEGWADVKSITFSFGDMVFSDAGQRSATVYLEMTAPLDDEVDKDPGREEYSTHNELLFSDEHTGSDGEFLAGCAKATPVTVNIKTTPGIDGGPHLPTAGGPGAYFVYAMSASFLLMGAMLEVRKKKCA